MNKYQTLFLIAALIISSLLGQAYGNMQTASRFCPITIKEKVLSSTLDIEEITPLHIKGKVDGNELRIRSGDEILVLKKGDEFQINSAQKFKNIKFAIPENKNFFSSKRSKYYYSVNNINKLESIKAANLVFYDNDINAKKAGKTFKE